MKEPTLTEINKTSKKTEETTRVTLIFLYAVVAISLIHLLNMYKALEKIQTKQEDIQVSISNALEKKQSVCVKTLQSNVGDDGHQP